jgi:predicted PurR-regulated permease PerM
MQPGAPRAAPPEPEERELVGELRDTEAPPPRVAVPRWVQLVALPFAILALWVLAKAAGKVLLLFIIAALIALVLNPLVTLVHRARLPRGLAVLAVYVAFFVALAGIGFLVGNPISHQVTRFVNNLPTITKEANKELESFERELNGDGIHVHLRENGKTALASLEHKVAKEAKKFASFGAELAKEAANVLFDLVLVFVLSVYMLLYGRQIGSLARRVMPRGDGTPADDYPSLVQRAVARYVVGQLIFSTVMGTSAGLALYLFGQIGIFPDGSKYALIFGAFYGLAELVPYIGPVLGAIPPVLVALFTKGPLGALWVVLLCVGLQQLEGHVVTPQIFGRTLRINPLLVIFSLLVGLEVGGVVGALVSLPILAVARETVVYLSRHLTLEPWKGQGTGVL